jgi:hypothetical protein
MHTSMAQIQRILFRDLGVGSADTKYKSQLYRAPLKIALFHSILWRSQTQVLVSQVERSLVASSKTYF